MRNRILFIVQVAVFILLRFEFDGEANEEGQPDFDKLSMVWPASVCFASQMKRTRCQTPFKRHFIIHTLQAMHKPDTPIKPYDKGGCKPNVEPADSKSITSELLSQRLILEDMKENWGSLKDYTNTGEESANIKFWRSQWTNQGICFGDPNDPSSYFATGLDGARSLIGDGILNFLNALEIADIKPNGTRYSEEAISKAIYADIKVVPQISCNKDSYGKPQFKGINVCYDRTLTSTSFMANCSVAFAQGCVFPKYGVLFPSPIM